MYAGRLVHLSGVDVLGPTAGSLARLLQDREMELWEGKRIVAQIDPEEVCGDRMRARHELSRFSVAFLRRNFNASSVLSCLGHRVQVSASQGLAIRRTRQYVLPRLDATNGPRGGMRHSSQDWLRPEIYLSATVFRGEVPREYDIGYGTEESQARHTRVVADREPAGEVPWVC